MEKLIETIILIIVTIALMKLFAFIALKMLVWQDMESIRRIKMKDLSLLRKASEQEIDVFVNNYKSLGNIYSFEKNLSISDHLFVTKGVITDIYRSHGFNGDLISVRHWIRLPDGTTFYRKGDVRDKKVLEKIEVGDEVSVFFKKIDDLDFEYQMYYPL